MPPVNMLPPVMLPVVDTIVPVWLAALTMVVAITLLAFKLPVKLALVVAIVPTIVPMILPAVILPDVLITPEPTNTLPPVMLPVTDRMVPVKLAALLIVVAITLLAFRLPVKLALAVAMVFPLRTRLPTFKVVVFKVGSVNALLTFNVLAYKLFHCSALLPKL